MAFKVFVGDSGTRLELDTEVSLSGAVSQTIELIKPSGVVVSLAATVTASTKVQAYSDASTFDEAGDWRLQARVVLPSGAWRGEAVPLRVYAAFEVF